MSIRNPALHAQTAAQLRLLLRGTCGDVVRAAQDLGVTPTTLLQRLRRHGIGRLELSLWQAGHDLTDNGKPPPPRGSAEAKDNTITITIGDYALLRAGAAEAEDLRARLQTADRVIAVLTQRVEDLIPAADRPPASRRPDPRRTVPPRP